MSHSSLRYPPLTPSLAQPRRCVGFVPGGASTHVSQEFSDLLRRRLRLGCTICAFAFGAFFVKNLIIPTVDVDFWENIIRGAQLAILAAITAVLWTRLPLGVLSLRLLELTAFGSMVVFFSYAQVNTYYQGFVLRWAQDDPVAQERVVLLSVFANSLRWLILIVIYGTFIPNTWQRCSWVVGGMAAVPLVLTFATCTTCPFMFEFWSLVIANMFLILAIAAAIAIFGSYKIAELQQQAYEARRLGQYVLRDKIGSGGMGEVYLAEHLLLRRKCAIKLIRPDIAGDPANRARFEREVQAMANLTHPNSVEVYDFGNGEDGTFYYVMEYLPGLTLDEIVRRFGPLEPARVVHFLRQICGALKEAHASGLIHRDIKPSNVLVCRRGGVDDVAKLLDFGLVQDLSINKQDDRLTLHGAIIGSPPYISPEQALNKANVDARTDIYGLGGLAYYLLIGQSPFVRETIMELLMAHVRDEVVSPRKLREEIPEDLEEIVLRCLAKKPDDRFDDIGELAKALDDCSLAEQWNAEQAEAWWREHRPTGPSSKPDEAVTVLAARS